MTDAPSTERSLRPIRLLAAAVLLLVGAVLVWVLRFRNGGRAPPDGPGEGRGAPVAWERSVVVDTGPGHVGPWRMNRSDWRYVDDPTVALAPGGDAAVAWVDQARKDVLFQRFGPGGDRLLPEPVNVSRTPGVFSWLPRIAADGERVYLLWQEIVFYPGGTHGGDPLFARSADGGRSFSEPVNLSPVPAGAGKGRMTPELWHNGSLDLAVGPGGTVLAAWTVYEGGLFVARSGDRGRSFSEPVRVSDGGAEPARGPTLVADSGDTVHVVWAVGGDPGADLRHAVSPDGGRSFSPPRVLFGGTGHADAPALATGPEGGLHLTWAESPEGAGGAYRIRHARRPAGEPRFGPPRTAAAPPEGDGSFRFPSVEAEGGGGPVVVFEVQPAGRSRPRGLGITAAPGGGAGFGPPGLVPGTADTAFAVNGSLQGYFMDKLAVGRDGRVAVVNSAVAPGTGSRVRLLLGRLR